LALSEFTNQGLRFEVTAGGDPQGRPVVLLHGFPADRHCWDIIAARLQEAGYRTIAPDQRGYSPGASPRPRGAYRIDALVSDVVALADAAGAATFDVVGHDWGAVVAWHAAMRHPDRVRSVAALSVPHPGAFAAALRHADQLRHSWYVGAFQLPVLPEYLMGRDHATTLRRQLQASGLDGQSAARYAQRASLRAMRGPLNWYRAALLDARRPPVPVEMPALFAWGDADHFVTWRAAAGCAAWMHGPARCETLVGVSHWIPETAGRVAGGLVVEHLRSC
jgi:pimeloyl-ACP methyl ester carboxylesterase